MSESRREYVGLSLIGLLGTLPLFIISPVLPQIVEEYGVSYVEVGYFLTVYSLAWSVLGLYSGHLSDRYGRKRIASIGLILYSAFAFLLGVARTFHQLITFRFIQDVGLGLFGPACLGLTVQFEEKGKSLSYYRAANGVGIVIGPTIGGILGSIELSYPFFLCGLLSLVALSALRLFPEQRGEDAVSFFESVRGMILNRSFMLLSIATFMAEITFASLEVIVPLAGSAIGLSSVWIGLVLTSYFVVFVVSQPIIGTLLVEIDKIRIVTIAAFIGAFPFAAMYLAGNLWVMVVAMCLLSVSLGTVFVQASAVVAEMAPKGRESTYMAFFDAVIDMSFPVAPVFITRLASFQVRVPFLFLSIFMISSASIYTTTRFRGRET